MNDPESRNFTIAALKGGLGLGLTEQEMRQVVCALTRRDFYKSMTTYLDSGVWQDVYHDTTMDSTTVYIKITWINDDCPPVIQFKEK